MREWLKNARSENGYTMAQLSEMLDITESYYSLIERGERQKRMDITLVTKLADALGMTIQEIVEAEQIA